MENSFTTIFQSCGSASFWKDGWTPCWHTAKPHALSDSGELTISLIEDHEGTPQSQDSFHNNCFTVISELRSHQALWSKNNWELVVRWVWLILSGSSWASTRIEGVWFWLRNQGWNLCTGLYPCCGLGWCTCCSFEQSHGWAWLWLSSHQYWHRPTLVNYGADWDIYEGYRAETSICAGRYAIAIVQETESQSVHVCYY